MTEPGSNVRSCARCQHTVFVRCAARQRSAPCDHNSPSMERWFPLVLTYTEGLAKEHGTLYAMVCRACGFVEWYAEKPEAIPIGRLHGTELVGAAPATPYR